MKEYIKKIDTGDGPRYLREEYNRSGRIVIGSQTYKTANNLTDEQYAADFYCSGTGDEVVIQNALDNYYVSEVVLLDGEYNIKGGITIPAAKTLCGSLNAKIYGNETDGAISGTWDGDPFYNMVACNGHATLKNLYLQDKREYRNSEAICLIEGDYVTVDNVKFNGHPQFCVCIQMGNYSTIKDCTFEHNLEKYTIGIYRGSDGLYTRIMGCKFFDTYEPINAGSTELNLTVTDCLFSGGAYITFPAKSVIDSNVFFCTNTELQVTFGNKSIITKNVFGDSMYISSFGTDSIVSNNQFGEGLASWETPTNQFTTVGKTKLTEDKVKFLNGISQETLNSAKGMEYIGSFNYDNYGQDLTKLSEQRYASDGYPLGDAYEAPTDGYYYEIDDVLYNLLNSCRFVEVELGVDAYPQSKTLLHVYKNYGYTENSWYDENGGWKLEFDSTDLETHHIMVGVTMTGKKCMAVTQKLWSHCDCGWNFNAPVIFHMYR